MTPWRKRHLESHDLLFGRTLTTSAISFADKRLFPKEDARVRYSELVVMLPHRVTGWARSSVTVRWHRFPVRTPIIRTLLMWLLIFMSAFRPVFVNNSMLSKSCVVWPMIQLKY